MKIKLWWDFTTTIIPRARLGPESIAHEANQRALAIFGRCEQYTIDSMVHLIGNEAAWEKLN